MAKAEQAKYTPDVLAIFKYRGFKVREIFNRKTKRKEFHTRFQINNKEFCLSENTRPKLQELIDEIYHQEKRAKHNLAVPAAFPLLKEVFEIHAPKISKPHQRKIFERVSSVLLALLPANIKINELKKAHFQKYIDLRLSQFGKQTYKPVLPETIDKELYAVSSALRAAPLYFPELENYQKPVLPKASSGKRKRRRRERLVDKTGELDKLLTELRKPRTGKQTMEVEKHRRRLADDLEFRFETGLRRKEVARLKVKQFDPAENCLWDVIRWKTGTVTKYFPLPVRAREIIEKRLTSGADEFIFTTDGEPVDSDYRTLKTVCNRIGINYGRFRTDGFTAHDFRHNFATEIIQHTDIKTAQEFLGHSNIKQTSDYLHTTKSRMREAIKKSERIDLLSELVIIYKEVRRRKTGLKKFLEKVKKLTEK